MVVDADALNALAAQAGVAGQPGGPRVLTPHPGEFARLIGRKLEGAAREAGGRRVGRAVPRWSLCSRGMAP